MGVRWKSFMLFSLILFFTGFSVYSLKFTRELPFSVFWTKNGNLLVAGETNDRRVILYKENRLYRLSVNGTDYELGFTGGYLFFRRAGNHKWTKWMPDQFPKFRLSFMKTAPFMVKWISPGFVEVGGFTDSRKILLYRENRIYEYSYQGFCYQITFYRGCFFYRRLNTGKWIRWLPDEVLAGWVRDKLDFPPEISSAIRVYLDEYSQQVVIEKKSENPPDEELHRLPVSDPELESRIRALRSGIEKTVRGF